MANPQFFQGWTQNTGRDGWDQPMAIPDDMSAESVNIELREGGLGKKRNGSEVVTFTGISGGGMFDLGRFVPGNDSTLSELFAFIGDTGTGTKLVRIPGGVASGAVLDTGLVRPIKYAQLNGKFFITNNSTINRLRVYDPNSSPTYRYAGLKPEGAPTPTNANAGAYPAVFRSYRVVVKRIISGIVVSQSEPSAEVSFTPDGVHLAVRVTKAALTGEGETHWAVQAAAVDGVFYEISPDILVGTLFWDDTTVPTDYPSVGTVPLPIGSNFPQPGAKFILSDGIHLFMLGVWATAQGDSVPPVNGRMYFTPALGSSDTGDDERVVDTTRVSGWIDVAVGGGGADRGLGGPINNAIAAFSSLGVYLFVPTNNADTPFRRIVLSTITSAVSQASVVMGEDENGRPALYFLDMVNGPYRISSGYTLQWIGKDVKDKWNSADLSVTEPEKAFWGTYDSTRKLVIWKVTPTSGDTFNIVCDVTNARETSNNQVRRGWSVWTEPANVSASSGLMFNSTLATSRPASMLMHYANPSAASVSLYRQTTSAGLDGATAYLAYITSKAYRWKPVGRLKKLLEHTLVGLSNAATTIRVRLTSNWGERYLEQTVSLAPVDSSVYVRPRPNPAVFADLQTLQVTMGDPTTLAGTSNFEIESWEGNLEEMSQKR